MTYLPRHPEIHCFGLAQERLEDHNRTVNTIALSLAVGFSLLLFWVEYSLRWELRLARNGETTVGRIIARTTVKGRSRTYYQAQYQFHAPDGARSGSATVSESLWGNLHFGTPVTVLYDPDHPSRHRPSFGFRFVQFLAEPEEE